MTAHPTPLRGASAGTSRTEFDSDPGTGLRAPQPRPSEPADDLDHPGRPDAFDAGGVGSTALGGGRGRGGWGGRGFGRRGRGGRRRHPALRFAAWAVAVLLVLAAGGTVYGYQHLNSNIKASTLFSGRSGNAGKEKPDAFGRTPINILAIGSDERANTADCTIGGDCSPGGGSRADVEMILHISADRSNMTVMSIPRDLMTELPACDATSTAAATAAHWGQINSALNNGPGCSVAAVHKLTGIPIDHFVKVDFSGVVSMSDAVGGVKVCVDNNVYDPYSHLKLSKGTHTLTGLAALEFLRTRHGFGDGGDIGRTEAQHIFLTDLMKKMKSAGTLTDPGAVWSLADAATKALTVDTGLDGITRLTGLADDLNKVPADRITFATMQTTDDTDPGESGRLLIAQGATSLFRTIADDVSLTTGSGAASSASAASTASAAGSASASSPSASASASAVSGAAVPASRIAVSVRNAGAGDGRAARIAAALVADGFSPQTTSGNYPGARASATTLWYGAGEQGEAAAVAAALGLPAPAVRQGSTPGLELILGSDWTSGTVYPSGTAAASSSSTGAGPSAASTRGALDNAHAANGSATSCAHVSTQVTVSVDGVPMTPVQAYANSPRIKESDRS